VATAGFLGLAASAFCAQRDLVLLAPLHSGSVYVYDLSTRARVATLPVEDGAGVVGIAVSGDGDSLYVVDGNDRDRLRLFNTRSWHQEWEQQFRDRLLALGAKQVVHLTADSRWLLIKTYDVGAAASGIRVFDTQKQHFMPVGLALQKCTEPRFASSPDGNVVATFPGLVEFLHSGPGETLSAPHEISIPLESPAGSAMMPSGSSVFILGTRDQTTPWQLIRVSLSPTPSVDSSNLGDLLAIGAMRNEEPTASILDLSQGGGHPLAIVSGASAWVLGTNPLRLQRNVRLPGALDGARLSNDGRVLYTLRRDTAKPAMLLGRINLETGETREDVLLENLPLSPVVWLFAFSDKAGR
jgi:dipeptidyl aminopeptidase/acylaminoacyl peptidase